MIKKYLKVIALRRLLERYERDIIQCIDYNSLSCIEETIEKYKQFIEVLISGED